MKIFKVLLIAYLSINFLSCSNHGSKYSAIIKDNGTVVLFEKRWSKNEYYQVKVRKGEWHWLSPEGIWKPLATPYESKFNDYGWILVLDKQGQIYKRKQDRTEICPLKVIDSKWYSFESGEWLEVPLDQIWY